MATQVQEFEKLKHQLEVLRDAHTKATVEVGSARKQLDALRKEAIDRYGVNTVPGLEALLKEKTETNAARLLTFQSEIATVRSDLAKISDILEG